MLHWLKEGLAYLGYLVILCALFTVWEHRLEFWERLKDLLMIVGAAGGVILVSGVVLAGGYFMVVFGLRWVRELAAGKKF